MRSEDEKVNSRSDLVYLYMNVDKNGDYLDASTLSCPSSHLPPDVKCAYVRAFCEPQRAQRVRERGFELRRHRHKLTPRHSFLASSQHLLLKISFLISSTVLMLCVSLWFGFLYM